MRLQAGVATDIGRVREGNEDSYLVEPPLYAVADGMGGHRGGEVASQLALEVLERGLRDDPRELAERVRAANRAVFDRSAADRKVTGMGTTLTAALIQGGVAKLAHVGDSRAYLLRAGAFRQLTQDHTLVARMVKAGEITPAEAELHPHRNVLTRALGTEADVEVDVQDVGLLEGDRLLLCSDGLTVMLTEDQVQAILESTSQAQEAAERLVRAANRAGGLDNITVLIVDALDGGDEERASHDPVGPTEVLAPPEPPSDDGNPVPGSRRLLRWALVVAAMFVVGFVGWTVFRTWVDGRWYVGEASGHVAVYQGVPATILGFDLSHVAVESGLSADEVAALPLYRGLAEGINANSQEDALAIVDQMRQDLREQRKSERGASP
jgi:serine/threonine protein phosphatase PrpC